jgi:predicted ATP-dependent serine protease
MSEASFAYACAECGHEQSTMDRCAKCRSVRVVLQSVIRDLFGEHWRDAFKDDGASKERP